MGRGRDDLYKESREARIDLLAGDGTTTVLEDKLPLETVTTLNIEA